MLLLTRVSLLALLAALAGCTGTMGTAEAPPVDPSCEDCTTPPSSVPGLAITAPEDGALLPSRLVHVRGTSDHAAVIVAGETVEVVDGAYETAIELPDGEQRIEVRAGDAEAEVSVTIDSAPPGIEIVSPAPGSFVQGNTVVIEGRAIDERLESVELDGEPVALGDDGSFSVTREVEPGAHRIRLTATDAAEHTSYAFTSALVGDFIAPGNPIERAAALELGSNALNSIAHGIAPLITPELIEPQVLAANHLHSGFYGWLDAQSYDHGIVEAELTPSAGLLTATVTVHDVRVPFRVDLRIGPDIHGTATVDRAVATVSARLSAADGEPVVEVAATDVELHGLFIDVSGLWDVIDRAVVTNALRGTIETSLDNIATAQVPPAIETALSRLPHSHLVDVGGNRALVSGDVRTFVVSGGVVRGIVDVGVRGLSDIDDDLAGEAPGSITLAGTYPPTHTGPDARATLSLDLINAALYAVWSTNALAQTIESPTIGDEPLTAGALALLAPDLRDIAPADAPVSLHLQPLLPAVLQPTDDAFVGMHVPDLRVRAIAQTEDGPVELFQLSVSVTAEVAISLVDDSLAVEIQDWTLVADPIGARVGMPEGPELDALLASLVGPLVEDYASLSGLNIPEVAGFSVSDLSAELSRGFLVVEGRLRRD